MKGRNSAWGTGPVLDCFPGRVCVDCSTLCLGNRSTRTLPGNSAWGTGSVLDCLIHQANGIDCSSSINSAGARQPLRRLLCVVVDGAPPNLLINQLIFLIDRSISPVSRLFIPARGSGTAACCAWSSPPPFNLSINFVHQFNQSILFINQSILRAAAAPPPAVRGRRRRLRRRHRRRRRRRHRRRPQVRPAPPLLPWPPRL